MNNNRIVVQSTHEKTHVENCFLLAKYACPPLVSKKLQAPPGDSFAYYYRPPRPKARVGSGICRLMQPLPGAEGHANLCHGVSYLQADLRKVLDLNIVVNLDNELEIELVDKLLQERDGNQNRVIGLRINPTFDEDHTIIESEMSAAFFVKTFIAFVLAGI